MRESPVRNPVMPGPVPAAAGARLPAAPLRVLLVEDSTRDWQLFEYLLEDFRAVPAPALDCERVRTGPQALQRLADTDFDLLVLDQNMPEMSGAEVLTAMAPLYAEGARTRPKVLAYSTCDTPEFRRQCLSDGADGFCSKYMTPRELLYALRALGLADGAAP